MAARDLILHGAWVARRAPGGALILWAERRDRPPAPPAANGGAPPYPFAADEADLRAALAAWAAGSGLDTPPAPWFPALPLWLPSHGGQPAPSYDAGTEAALAPWAVGALALAPLTALGLLLRPPAPEDRPPAGRRPARLGGRGPAGRRPAGGRALPARVAQR